MSVPGDKSVSHRAVMLGGIATGTTEIAGFLPGEDCCATVNAMRALGVTIDEHAPDQLSVSGVGSRGLSPPDGELYLGNSGTGMRLLAGLLAGMPFDCVLTGDASLSSRPMGRIANPLQAMGARIRTTDGHAPLSISGHALQGIDYEMSVPSAQVKSALLLAALYAEGETRVRQTAVTRDHTERMLRWLGADLEESGRELRILGPQQLTGRRIDVPGDFSAAAFFIVAGLIAGDDVLTLTNVGVNPTRIGLIDLLSMMGADINVGKITSRSGEPVANIEVRPGQLRGIDVPPELVSLAIDEFPVFFIAAACAEGVTRVSEARELRVKESDRIAVMADGLSKIGVLTNTTDDGISITGGSYGGGVVDSNGDHRIAMAFAVASLAATEEIRIVDTANVATSFPNFVDAARAVGFNIEHDESRDSSGHCN